MSTFDQCGGSESGGSVSILLRPNEVIRDGQVLLKVFNNLIGCMHKRFVISAPFECDIATSRLRQLSLCPSLCLLNWHSLMHDSRTKISMEIQIWYKEVNTAGRAVQF